MSKMFFKTREGARFWWHQVGLPGVALFVWLLGTSIYQWNLIDRLAAQPGPYHAPAKVAERKHAKGTANAGSVILAAMTAFHMRRRQIAKEAQEATIQTPYTEC